MNDKHETIRDSGVDKAIDALNSAKISAGPPAEALQAILDAGGTETIRTRKGILHMNRITKIAASILVIAAVGAAFVWMTLGTGGATVAWADVQRIIRNARTMTMKATMEMELIPGTPTTMEMTMMFKEPGLMRQEMTMGSSKIIGILDIQQNKMITLMEAKKTATVYDLTEMSADMRKRHEEQDFLGRMKALIEKSETELGEKEIDGRATKGYRVKEDNQIFTIWADAETGQLVEVNMTMFQGETKMTMSDFEFDVELDDSLFSLDIPEGYTVEKDQITIKEASVDDVVELLRVWTMIRGGTFPDALTPGCFQEDAMDAKDREFEQSELSEHDGRKLALSMTRTWMLLALNSEAHYAGKGVKLGDAETPVFWYKSEGSETYKVIYGDLHVEDVAEEDLPEVPAEE